MKKLASILFTCFYLVSTIGLTVNYHFCSGELVSVSVLGAPKGCCGKEGMEKGCCQNKQLTKRIHDGHQTPVVAAVPGTGSQDLYLFNTEVPYLEPSAGTFFSQQVSRIHGPPDPVRTDVYLLNRSIRI